MTGYLEIVVIAALLQLTVLPGEKVQFIIAGLSTRYSPYLVVAAAGSAFAGWTAVEILVGEAIRRVLPGVVLDAITAVLFLLFAVMLYRSAPESAVEFNPAETDGGMAAVTNRFQDASVAGVELPDRVGTFLSIFAMMATGEFGDKTQLVTFGLAAQYGATSAIWVGEMLVIIPISLANALFFHRFTHRFDVRKAHFLGAAIFAFFGLDTVLSIVTAQLYGEAFSVWGTIVNAVSEALLAAI